MKCSACNRNDARRQPVIVARKQDQTDIHLDLSIFVCIQCADQVEVSQVDMLRMVAQVCPGVLVSAVNLEFKDYG